MTEIERLEEIAPDDRTLVFILEGDWDLSNTPRFLDRMLKAVDGGRDQIVIDMCGTRFFDSMMISALLRVYGQLEAVDGRLVVVCPEERLRHIFAVAGLDEKLQLHDTRDDALAELGSPSA